MEKPFIRRQFLSIPHLPTFLLFIGYICYWLELYFVKRNSATTSFLATGLFFCFSVFLIIRQKNNILKTFKWCVREFRGQGAFLKIIIFFAGIIGSGIILNVFLALCLPPHLPQEFDSLNYHLTIPRQHLILGSFSHIGWSSADLFPMPIQFALAPYWFLREVPGKLIHIFFTFGLLAVSLNIVRKLSKNNFLSLAVIFAAVLGSHNIGIQMPILMLDIVMAYLFIAGVDSFLQKNFFLSAIEFSFFVWSKSFYLPQMIVVTCAILIAVYFLKKIQIKKISFSFQDTAYDSLINRNSFKKLSLCMILAGIFIGGPFVFKSLYYAGTPLFPFYPGIVSLPWIDKVSGHWQSILSSSKMHFATKDAYGTGRSLWEFIKQLWIIAVPEKNAVNRYDYPLGLPYLLFLGPFLYFTAVSFLRKKIPILSLFVIVFWVSWWLGSQQARFLYIPLLLIFILVSSALKAPPRVFLTCLVIALLFNLIAIYRAHSADFLKRPMQVMRQKDKDLLEMNKAYGKVLEKKEVILDYYDAAYAVFPVKVSCDNDYWVLK